MEEINSLLKKYKNFVGAQVRSIRATSETSKVVTLVLQDDDGEDISSVKLELKVIGFPFLSGLWCLGRFFQFGPFVHGAIVLFHLLVAHNFMHKEPDACAVVTRVAIGY